MCGIAGVVNAHIHPQHVQAMIDCIQYRGRDDNRMAEIGRAVIGHVRLAVVDLVSGKQPFSNADQTVWTVFNGEIYNYVELREELEAKGYVFRSRCDTEVLVHLWREEGENMLSRLIGIFAFFLWDTKQDRGILARDRQGIKPCFIADYQGGLAFASEMKSLFKLPGLTPEVNANGLKDVFSFNYCPPPATCFKGVMHLEPGCYVYIDGEKAPVKKRYWEWPLADPKVTPSFEAFEAMLDDAVRLQMRFDVKGGLYLSGGVDSSVVAYHLKKQWTHPRLEAFGLHFPVEGFSEFPHAKTVADLLDIDLQEALITPELIPANAEKIVYHAEQPHGDFSFFLFYLLAQRANSQDKVVMFNGDGPDEMMGGQHLHNAPGADFTLADYLRSICYMDLGARRVLLNPDFERATLAPEARFAELVRPWSHLEPVEQIVGYECTSLMAGNNLVKGDRMGACWSIEGRSPLLDHRISEMLARLPTSQRFQQGVSKYYLKSYAATKLPRDIIFKKKTMPTLPIGEWIKHELYDWAHATLSRADANYMNKQAVMALLAEHTSGAKNHTRSLRTLIMTQLWLEQCVTFSSHRQAA